VLRPGLAPSEALGARDPGFCQSAARGARYPRYVQFRDSVADDRDRQGAAARIAGRWGNHRRPCESRTHNHRRSLDTNCWLSSFPTHWPRVWVPARAIGRPEAGPVGWPGRHLLRRPDPQFLQRSSIPLRRLSLMNKALVRSPAGSSGWTGSRPALRPPERIRSSIGRSWGWSA